MSYLFINALRPEAAITIANELKAKLSERTDRPCLVVQDCFPSNEQSLGMFDKLEQPFTPVKQKMAILLGFRSFLLKRTILPALEKGEIVLQVGGFLDDRRYIPETKLGFEDLLKENLEIIRATKRFELGCPVGSVYSQSLSHDAAAWGRYRFQTRRVGNTLPRFRVFPYLRTAASTNNIIKHLL